LLCASAIFEFPAEGGAYRRLAMPDVEVSSWELSDYVSVFEFQDLVVVLDRIDR